MPSGLTLAREEASHLRPVAVTWMKPRHLLPRIYLQGYKRPYLLNYKYRYSFAQVYSRSVQKTTQSRTVIAFTRIKKKDHLFFFFEDAWAAAVGPFRFAHDARGRSTWYLGL